MLYSSAHSQGIKGAIRDAKTNKPLPSRIIITDDTGHIYNSYYNKLNGFFTEEDGTFFQELKNAHYTLEVFRGIDYVSRKFDIHINGRIIDTTILLDQWYPLKKEGWYNGDGHDHLYTDLRPDTAMLKMVRKICRAQGVDFMCTAQGWSGYNDSTWKSGYAEFTDNNFHFSYGSEMPKYRTGHTWWLGQQSTYGLFESTMDTAYENQYYQSEKGTGWNFEQLPFPELPDIEVVNRFKKSDGSIAVAAHPTSWWMQKRGDIEKYVTNVACNLSFGLLSGKIWDGIVAMGYDHDHYFYQNLWFNILNHGYRMPAFAELDGGLGKDDKFYYGSMRTYFHVDGEFNINKVVTAAKKGNSFLTSGPIIIARIDNKYNYGDIIPAHGEKHVLQIDAYASGDKNDYLSYIIVFRNGKIFKLWDVRNEKKRSFKRSVPVKEKNRSWYIVKAYGKNAWVNPMNLDVMAACANKKNIESFEGQRDVAFTNPFYFRSKNERDPEVLTSNVHLTLSEKKSATIEISVAGEKIKTVRVLSGQASFQMPVNGVLKIIADGVPTIYRSLYLDYFPHRNLIEDLASGKWKENYNVVFHPGEVPWDAFNFDRTIKILSNVHWYIPLKPNERDQLYADPAYNLSSKR
ncbi:MAG TPA: hypothetical protein VM101_03715 [Flavitalea sp.]|nr:hypothetical protein [Flavitalea sp.]